MANDRPGFYVYHEMEDEIEYMTDLQRGQLLRALIAYSRRGEILDDIDPMVLGCFYCQKSSIDRNSNSYNKRREANRVNGAKAKKQDKTETAENEQMEPNGSETSEWDPMGANGSETSEWDPMGANDSENNHNYNYSSNSSSNNNYSSRYNQNSNSSPNYTQNQNNNQNNNCEGEETVAIAPPHAPARGIYKNVILSDEEYRMLAAQFPDIDSRVDRLSEYMAVSGKGYANHYATIRQFAREDCAKSPAISPESASKSTAGTRDCGANGKAGEAELAAIRRLQQLKRQQTTENREQRIENRE